MKKQSDKIKSGKLTKKQLEAIRKNKKCIKRKVFIGIFCLLILILIAFCIFKVVTYKEFFKISDRTKEIEKYEKNEDYTIVGWLKIQGTNIDYPILFYDDAPISDVTQNIGWTYRNVKELDDRTVIEGHNILNLSSNPLIADKNSRRFEQLLSFYDPMFVKNNKYVEYSLNNENYVFKIFAVGFPEIESYYTKFEYTKEEKQDYIETAIDDSLYKFDLEVDSSDKIISLYTCTKFYGYDKAVVFRVDARLLREGEKIENYGVSKTINYQTAKSYADSVNDNQEVES